MTQDITVNYNIGAETMGIAKYIFQKKQNLDEFKRYEIVNMGQLLILLGGFELEIENNMTSSELAEYGKIRSPKLEEYTYFIATNIPADWHQDMLAKFKKLYPPVPENQINNYIANMGVAFLTKVDQLGVKMPTNKELKMALNPNMHLAMEHK